MAELRARGTTRLRRARRRRACLSLLVSGALAAAVIARALERRRAPLAKPEPRRSTSEVVEDHLMLQQQGRIEEDIAKNFHEQVVVMARGVVHHGAVGVRAWRRAIDSRVQALAVDYSRVLVADEVAMIEWSAHGDGVHVDGGVESLVVRGGRIVAQMVSFTMHSTPHT